MEIHTRTPANLTAKVFISQALTALNNATNTSNLVINGAQIYRFWLQGLVVDISLGGHVCKIDDGTGLLDIDMKTFAASIPKESEYNKYRPKVGDYVMVIGRPQKAKEKQSRSSIKTILAHQVICLHENIQRESIWFLEVIEYWTAVI